MKYLILVAFLASVLMLSSCGKVDQSPDYRSASMGAKGMLAAGAPGGPGMAPMMSPGMAGAPTESRSPDTTSVADYSTAGASLYVIKTADLNVEVENIDSSVRQVVLFVKNIGGFIESSESNREGADKYFSATVIARVPSQSFERTVENVGGVGKIKSKSITGQDVTGQIFDSSARLRNKKAEEAQYVEIMQKAKRIPDIVSVSNELFRVREEIERLQGSIKGLKTAADMSTISIRLTKATSSSDKHSISKVFGDAWLSLVATSVVLLGLVIWLLVYSPYWIGLILVIWLVRRARNSRRQHQ